MPKYSFAVDNTPLNGWTPIHILLDTEPADKMIADLNDIRFIAEDQLDKIFTNFTIDRVRSFYKIV